MKAREAINAQPPKCDTAQALTRNIQLKCHNKWIETNYTEELLLSGRENEGLWSWKQSENNNRMIAAQNGVNLGGPGEDNIRLAYL